jgi:hypothetical protein
MKYLSRRSAAAQLDVSVTTFDEYRKKYPGVLEPIYLEGKRPRWTEAQLDSFVGKFANAYRESVA